MRTFNSYARVTMDTFREISLDNPEFVSQGPDMERAIAKVYRAKENDLLAAHDSKFKTYLSLRADEQKVSVRYEQAIDNINLLLNDGLNFNMDKQFAETFRLLNNYFTFVTELEEESTFDYAQVEKPLTLFLEHVEKSGLGLSRSLAEKLDQQRYLPITDVLVSYFQLANASIIRGNRKLDDEFSARIHEEVEFEPPEVAIKHIKEVSKKISKDMEENFDKYLLKLSNPVAALNHGKSTEVTLASYMSHAQFSQKIIDSAIEILPSKLTSDDFKRNLIKIDSLGEGVQAFESEDDLKILTDILVGQTTALYDLSDFVSGLSAKKSEEELREFYGGIVPKTEEIPSLIHEHVSKVYDRLDELGFEEIKSETETRLNKVKESFAESRFVPPIWLRYLRQKESDD